MANEKKTKGEVSNEPKYITIENEKYSLDDLSEDSRKALNTLQFSEQRIAQLRGEMALATTARTGLISILKSKLKKISD